MEEGITEVIINKNYLETVLASAVEVEVNCIAHLLNAQAEKGRRYVCICRGKRKVLDENVQDVIDGLKKRGIEPDSSDEGYKFSCPCSVNREQPERCKGGYVFKF